ncbi:MAG: hypothetical protein K1X88_15915 [Nannocystaceae bacterium]|nr:hypothetical protein [Nannocystaceae bacterium]
MQRRELTVFVDYHQFYLWDAGSSPQAPEDFDAADIAARVKVAPHVVVVQPVRNDEVPVSFELHERDPGVDPAAFDHLVECSLALPTGQLQLHEVMGGAVLELRVPPGSYRVRVGFAGLARAGDDRYAVVMWPAEQGPLQVIRRFAEAPA